MRFWITVVVGIFIVAAGSTLIYVVNPDMQRTAGPNVEIAVETADPANAPKAVAPVMEESKEDVPQLQKGESTFKITNEGTARLDLKVGKPSCTCVGAALRKPKMNADDSEGQVFLEPGESADFIVLWDTQDRVGPFGIEAPVITNDPAKKTMTFAVRLQVVPDLLYEPEYLNFGVLSQGQEAERNLYIFSAVRDDVIISEPRASSPTFETTVIPLAEEELRDGKIKSGARIQIKLKANGPVGEFMETVYFKTNLQRMPNALARMTGRIEGAFQMTPSRIDFGSVSGKSPVGYKVQIFAKGLEDGRTLEVGEVHPPFLKATIEKDPKLKVLWRLKVELPAGARGGPFVGQVSVNDSEGNRRLNLGVQGVVSGTLETAKTAK